MREFLALLLSLGCSQDARITIDPYLEVPGFYRDGGLTIRPDITRAQLAHECAHSRQPKATTAREWELNEREAKMAELREREE